MAFLPMDKIIEIIEQKLSGTLTIQHAIKGGWDEYTAASGGSSQRTRQISKTMTTRIIFTNGVVTSKSITGNGGKQTGSRYSFGSTYGTPFYDVSLGTVTWTPSS